MTDKGQLQVDRMPATSLFVPIYRQEPQMSYRYLFAKGEGIRFVRPLDKSSGPA